MNLSVPVHPSLCSAVDVLYVSYVLAAFGDSGEFHKHRGAEMERPCGSDGKPLGTD